MNIDLLYLKTICVLHRTYLSHDRSNVKFKYSRDTCAWAALQILRHQSELHFACQPEGPFFKDRWMLSSITLRDFLLAAMIISLDLYEHHNRPHTLCAGGSAQKVQEYDALRLAHDIWKAREQVSRDARRATKVISAMLHRISQPINSAGAVEASQPTPKLSPKLMHKSGDSSATAISATDSSTVSSWNKLGANAPEQIEPRGSFTPQPHTEEPLSSVFDASDNLD